MGSPASLHFHLHSHQSDLMYLSGDRAFKVLLTPYCCTHDSRLIGAQSRSLSNQRSLICSQHALRRSHNVRRRGF